MTKTLLKISQCAVDKNGKISTEGKVFTVLLNPTEFTHAFSIAYNKKQAMGQVAGHPKFGGVNCDKVTFSILLDGTGVVLPGPGKKPIDVATSLRDLAAVVYTYVGKRHQPSPVQLLWGTMIFYGRLESMSTQHTLFKPDGMPLRAKVSMGFIGFMSKEEGSLVANQSSPDRSHRVLVKEGDTLPMLCNDIYGDPWYYKDVARFNKLTDFRRLTPGVKLHFPPLE